jgi:hypothetical protein
MGEDPVNVLLEEGKHQIETYANKTKEQIPPLVTQFFPPVDNRENPFAGMAGPEVGSLLKE